MYFVVIKKQHHIPCKWKDLSVYETLEIDADDRYQLCGQRKDNGDWEIILEFDTRNEIEVWCNDNIPLGGGE